MSILIAPIGIDTNHVKAWLREISSDAEVLWLIHSKKDSKHDFPKIAKTLEKEIKKMNGMIEIQRRVIDDAFSIEPTMDAIAEIIDLEEKKTPSLIRKDFVLNITGGTNAVAAATMLSATFFGTKANYVLQRFSGDSRGKKYVVDLPVKPIGSAKMKESQLKVLKIIANSQYIIENTPIGVDPDPVVGMISRNDLLDKMGWSKSKSTTLHGITSKLEKDGMIESLGYTEFYVLPDGKRLESNKKLDKSARIPRIPLGGTFVDWPLEIKKNSRETAFKITTLGKTTSRHSLMF